MDREYWPECAMQWYRYDLHNYVAESVDEWGTITLICTYCGDDLYNLLTKEERLSLENGYDPYGD